MREVNCTLLIQINSKASINNRQSTETASRRTLHSSLPASNNHCASKPANIEFYQISTLYSTTQPLEINKTVFWPKYHNLLIKKKCSSSPPAADDKTKSAARSGTVNEITRTDRLVVPVTFSNQDYIIGSKKYDNTQRRALSTTKNLNPHMHFRADGRPAEQSPPLASEREIVPRATTTDGWHQPPGQASVSSAS